MAEDSQPTEGPTKATGAKGGNQAVKPPTAQQSDDEGQRRPRAVPGRRTSVPWDGDTHWPPNRPDPEDSFMPARRAEQPLVNPRKPILASSLRRDEGAEPALESEPRPGFDSVFADNLIRGLDADSDAIRAEIDNLDIEQAASQVLSSLTDGQLVRLLLLLFDPRQTVFHDLQGVLTYASTEYFRRTGFQHASESIKAFPPHRPLFLLQSEIAKLVAPKEHSLETVADPEHQGGAPNDRPPDELDSDDGYAKSRDMLGPIVEVEERFASILDQEIDSDPNLDRDALQGAIKLLEEHAERTKRVQVHLGRLAHRNGVTWRVLGDWLGITESSAYRRFDPEGNRKDRSRTRDRERRERAALAELRRAQGASSDETGDTPESSTGNP